MSNFAFIADQFPSLAETAIGAEKLIYVYPPAAIMAARQSLESLVLWLYTYDKKLSQPFDNSLSNLLREPCFTKLVPEHVILKMDTIRIIGNKYVHGKVSVPPEKQKRQAISTIADLSKLHKKTPVHIDFVREFLLSENDQFYFTSFKLRTIS